MIKNIANSSIAIAKVASKGLLKHIFFIGFSLLMFIVGIILLGTTDGSGLTAAGHTGIFGAIVGVFYLFVLDFWPMLLCVTSLIVFPFLYFTLINKGIIHAALFQLWKKNLESWFVDKITVYTTKYLSGANTVSKINDQANLKLKLISDIKDDKTNSSWQRRILSFMLKKIKLDDFDASKHDASISKLIVAKATGYVSEMGKPSNKPVWLLFGGQIVIVIFAIMFNN